MSWQIYRRPRPRRGSARVWITGTKKACPVARFNYKALALAGLSIGDRCCWLIDKKRRVAAICRGDEDGWKISPANASGAVGATVPLRELGRLPKGAYAAKIYQYNGAAAVGFEAP